MLRIQAKQSVPTSSTATWRLRPRLFPLINSFSTLSPPKVAPTSGTDFDELSRQATTIIESKYLQKEEAEIDAALFLDSTSTPEVLARAALHSKKQINSTVGLQPDDFSKLIHRAFLHLTAKNLVHASPDMAIELARRAHRFGLCFHLPLYEQLVATVATHYAAASAITDTSDRPCSVILEMSSFACQALQVALEGRFFCSSLMALTQRNLLRDAVVVLRAMKDRHDIHTLPSDVTIQLLTILKEHVVAGVVDESDASDLMLTLHSMLLDEFEDGPSEVMGEEGNLLESLTDILDDYDSDAFDERFGGALDDDEDDKFLDMLDMEPAEIREAMSAYLQQRDWSPSDDQQDGDAYAIAVYPNEQDMPVYGTTASILNRHHDNIMKEAIYLRDSTLWKLPDVTEQLEKLMDGPELLYTHAHEEQLLTEMIAAESAEPENY
jgi:hypothetical protein